MQLDPSLVCVRTFAGDAEARKATHGLSISQRRSLMLLERPRSVAGFAAQHHLDPARVERDLLRLAELALVALITPAHAQELAASVAEGAAD